MTITTKPLVSIVIPVFNGENYLREAIDSALAQTYKPIETIVVNDGSCDKSEEIALSYGNRIRYIKKENGGVSTALNIGIANMQGEYFSWLSHDDLYEPEKIEFEIAAISENPTQIVYSDYSVIDLNGKIITNMNIAEMYPNIDKTFGLFPIMQQVLNGCTLLIHKSHFIRNGMFNEDLRFTQDYDLWFKMFRDMELAYVNVPLVMSREHGAQVTHSYELNRSESDELWLNMLKSITYKEACKLDSTEQDFWNNQTAFLQYTPYKKAKAYAKSRLKALGGGTVTIGKLVKKIAYKILSGVSRLTRFLGIQKLIKKSKLFNWGYKIWFKVRYK